MKLALDILSATLAATSVIVASSALSANMDSFSLPPAMKLGSVSFISGGIGKDEAIAFQRDAKNFPLEMEFVMKDEPRDAFLANVRVTIRNSAGRTVLNTVSQGPFLLATLPPGKYDVTADIDGTVKHEVVSVNAHKHERDVLVWPNTARLNG